MKTRHRSKHDRASRADRNAHEQTASNPPGPAKPSLLPRWLLLVLCLLAAGGGSYALAVGFLFSKLPTELLGKWVVQGGPQDGAAFDFFRSGRMEARLNNNDKEVLLKARAAVEGKKLLTTTKNLHTEKEETNITTIRELTGNSLVIETRQGEVFRMTRAD